MTATTTAATTATKGWAEGWGLFWTLTLALAAMALGFLFVLGWDTDGYRMVIRATARTSLVLFLAAFAASAAFKLWPGPFTRWLRRNRRQLGLDFAMSHFIHALVIIALWKTDPDTFWVLTNPKSIVTGGTAYLFIALLAATSFDRMVKALGPKAWGRLHWWGVWIVALSFIFTNGKRIPVSGWYALPVALVVAVIVLRVVAGRKQRRAAALA
ncbi:MULTISPECIES: ferric reductase-like transmembrane domain-containing protein [unclassified Sphingopyxis]|jgi:DMSO/TMAO reductase YedYZ heme-binding membrane subunit|uniref:ferric reductase-like transmembrane domain-containing protein n=1 Tax=unclassified Sphingopyxis TaxID=2614943 RepID=UPI0025DF2007|nr:MULTISPECIES: ferric reductase-like transmembrane domain-containing protein [unclassified Sphingopyxis]